MDWSVRSCHWTSSKPRRGPSWDGRFAPYLTGYNLDLFIVWRWSNVLPDWSRVGQLSSQFRVIKSTWWQNLVNSICLHWNIQLYPTGLYFPRHVRTSVSTRCSARSLSIAASATLPAKWKNIPTNWHTSHVINLWNIAAIPNAIATHESTHNWQHQSVCERGRISHWVSFLILFDLPFHIW